jgi:hypothetical protein
VLHEPGEGEQRVDLAGSRLEGEGGEDLAKVLGGIRVGQNVPRGTLVATGAVAAAL